MNCVRMNIRKATRITAVLLLFLSEVIVSCTDSYASSRSDNEIKPSELYARSAVLMDADSGRILYGKNASQEAPMASTTKIMTCIIALEEGEQNAQVRISEYASSQPEVKLGMKEGDKFILNDLLYSLMLESHNDSAVAIAEHIAGSVQAFADLMNQKAKIIGCESTYYITPNGLDAEDSSGIHHTTAADLALVMRYCIMQSPKKSDFLKITRTESYSFSDCTESVSYNCRNHNSFLKMMDGALSGKTGFTSDAGYCYVGALKRDSRTFIVALLACGWPNNKGYKWSDTIKLMGYGLENYHNKEITPGSIDEMLTVSGGFSTDVPELIEHKVKLRTVGENMKILLKDNEKIDRRIIIPDCAEAPVRAGDEIGKAEYYINGSPILTHKIISESSVDKRTFGICLYFISQKYFMNASGVAV